MSDEQIYWYARGYYEGRAHGNDEGIDAAYSDETRHAYRQGYDCGVSDYCDLDERSGETK